MKCRQKVTQLPLNFLASSKQIEDAGFSLNHPNQYFTESQRLLGGGREIKKEVEIPQKAQESTAANGAPAQPQPNSSQALEEMGDLDSYFADE